MGNVAAAPLTADPRTIDADLRRLPLWLITAVLWAYVMSRYRYRIWYEVAAIAVFIAVMLVASGVLRTCGFTRAIAPVFVYFGLALASAGWAMYPDDTLRWLAIDSISIVVFALSFLTGRNTTPTQLTTAFMTLTIPSVIMAAVAQIVDPTAPRSAEYAGAVLAFLPPFLYLRALIGRRRWPAVLAMVVAFAVLIYGRSRTPLAAAILLTVIAVVVFRKQARLTIRDALIFGALVVVTTVMLLLVPITRKPMVMMFVRLTHIGVVWGDLNVPAEPTENWQRVDLDAVSRALLPEAIPFGIGYGNFVRRFHRVTGYYLPIHNIYMSWLVEGGLLAWGAVLWLATRHIRSLRACIQGAPTLEQRAHGQLIAIASVGILTIGVYHQVHQNPMFWVLLGLGAACSVKESDAEVQELPLLQRWRQIDPALPAVLCEPLMSTALRHLSGCERGGVLVDVGCGNGSMLSVFQDNGYRAIGIDAELSVLRGTNVIPADGAQLPIQSDAADGIFVFSAFQYMDRDRALAECRRVLKPGGRIAVIENLAGNPITRLSRVVRRRRGVRYSQYMEPRNHLQWRHRMIYERYFSDVHYELHHVTGPLFLLTKNRVVLAALRILQRLERRALAAGLFRGGAWHVVITGHR